MGPFTYQSSNPFSYKPGGFARGAGHGSTYQDPYKNWWHVSTMVVNMKNNFERRIGIWPAGFDSDDILFSNTAFGDYPQFLPSEKKNHLNGNFTGWMLLNYNKPVEVSSTYGGFSANNAVDEDIRTYWCAATGNAHEWIQTDLGNPSTIYAVQINYADQDVDSTFLGKIQGIYHQYILWESSDGKNWKILLDKSHNRTDIPHEYLELSRPVTTRYLKLENIHMPTGKFAISGLRVFGKGSGGKPDTVKQFIVLRSENDSRNALIKWITVNDATGYNIYWGVAPNKLYNNVMVYNDNQYYFKPMDKGRTYYFSIEAFNENGISEKTKPIEVLSPESHP